MLLSGRYISTNLLYRYNKAIHDFYLAESTPSPSTKDDKWEEYIFVIRRRFGMYSFLKLSSLYQLALTNFPGKRLAEQVSKNLR